MESTVSNYRAEAMMRRVALPILLVLCVASYGQVPIVTSVSPESGPVGTEVTITGSNFGTDASAVSVFFGSVKALVVQSSASEIRARVPGGAVYRPLSILVNGLYGFSPRPFLVTSANETLINASSFSEATTFDVGGAPGEVLAADFDRDGKTDLVIANGKNLTALRNTTTPGRFNTNSFTRSDIFADGTAINSLAIGDIDGDGKTDLVAVSAATSPNTITVFKNNCSPGAITEASFKKATFSTGPNPSKVILSDLDFDGKLDVITANGNNSLSVLKNTTGKNGINFDAALTINATTPGSAKTVSAADLDGDGKEDLISYNFWNNVFTVSVLRNQAMTGDLRASSFALPVSYGSGLVSESDIAVADFDNDRKPELLANFGNNAISVFKNLTVPGSFTSASFATKVDFGTGAGPFAAKCVADLNGDGFPDVLSTNRESNTVSIFQNKGQTGIINTATFLPKVDLVAGARPTGVTVGDFDGDGMTDIAVVSKDSRSASWLR